MTQRIAVLGGGAGSLTTVFALTSEPDWQSRYDITVYVHGWRLGGKGASGRNAALGQRIEEHGFHIWMGFYHNAFAVMRDAYAERARILPDPGIFTTWRDAYEPLSMNVLVEHIDGQFKPWAVKHPPGPASLATAGPTWRHGST